MDTPTTENGTLWGYVEAQMEANLGRLTEVAKDLDMPYTTLLAIRNGQTKNPGVHTIQRMADYFKARENLGVRQDI